MRDPSQLEIPLEKEEGRRRINKAPPDWGGALSYSLPGKARRALACCGFSPWTPARARAGNAVERLNRGPLPAHPRPAPPCGRYPAGHGHGAPPLPDGFICAGACQLICGDFLTLPAI